jgi:RNA polymerase subunit RPABC4/transcription elongation factor Spt4
MLNPSKKTCDHCGQDINRDAFVCQYCGRAQAPKPAAPPRQVGTRRQLPLRTRLVLIAAAAYVLLTMVANWWRSAGPVSPLEPARTKLEVYGRRGSSGFELVNHETEPLSACVVTLQNEWRAMIQTFKPEEVRSLTWSEFKSRGGADMPALEGQRARSATVRCDSHHDTRRDAALAFR